MSKHGHSIVATAVRYERDARFHQLVDLLTCSLAQCGFTADDLREAADLAATRSREWAARLAIQIPEAVPA